MYAAARIKPGERRYDVFPRTKACLWSFYAVLHCDLVRPAALGGQYKNFRVAVYIPASVVERMKDPQWRQLTWETINLQLKVDKVYIETYRSQHIVDEQVLEQVKQFFLDRGVQVAGGIAHTSVDARQFQTFSYADPKEREYVKRISEVNSDSICFNP